MEFESVEYAFDSKWSVAFFAEFCAIFLIYALE